eukprot:4711170-Prymnesium_polylepis.1
MCAFATKSAYSFALTPECLGTNIVTSSPSLRRCAHISSSSGPHDPSLPVAVTPRRHAISTSCSAAAQSDSTST